MVAQWQPPVEFVTVTHQALLNVTLHFRLEPAPAGTLLHTHIHRDDHQSIDDLPLQLEVATAHPELYMHSLAEYLEHFLGRDTGFAQIFAPESSEPAAGFERL